MCALTAMPPMSAARPSAKTKAGSKAKAAPKASSKAKAAPKARSKATAARTPRGKARRVARAAKVHRLLLRRQAVKELNALAEGVGVPRIRCKTTDSETVERLVLKLQERCTEDALRRRLSAALKAWVSNGARLTCEIEEICIVNDTDAGMEDDDVPILEMHEVLKKGYKLKSRAFMMTYHSKDFSLCTWDRFRSWLRRLARKLGAAKWAACLEKTLQPSKPRADGEELLHIHAYLAWKSAEGYEARNTDALVFEGVRPRIDKCSVSNPKRWKVAVRHGMWYVTVMKEGTIISATNCGSEVPKPQWVTSLWEEHKLSHAQFDDHSIQLRVGHCKRKRDLVEVRQSERSQAVALHVLKAQKQLLDAGVRKPFREFPEINRYVEQFDSVRFRRAILVIIGGTNLGKSELAWHVVELVGAKLKLKGVLEVTVENNETLDLSEQNIDEQAGVVFDGVGDAMTLKQNREMLQGRAKVCQGGKSATMMYAYNYTLHNRAIVATFDLSAKGLSLFHTDHWLANEKNVIVLRLTEPVWDNGPSHAPHTPLGPLQQMHGWSVNEMANWLESRDLAGPAGSFRLNGVSGEDFIAFSSAESLESDLRLTPFCARKLLSVRDQFLQR